MFRSLIGTMLGTHAKPKATQLLVSRRDAEIAKDFLKHMSSLLLGALGVFARDASLSVMEPQHLC